MTISFDHYCQFVSGYLLGYAGRTLAELPTGVEYWLRWAYTRGCDAQSAADFLADVSWPARVTLDADPLVPRRRKEVLGRITQMQIAAG